MCDSDDEEEEEDEGGGTHELENGLPAGQGGKRLGTSEGEGTTEGSSGSSASNVSRFASVGFVYIFMLLYTVRIFEPLNQPLV